MSKINTTNPMVKFMAEALLQIKSETAAICFFTTVWNGSPIMLAWSPLQNGIIDCYGNNSAEVDLDVMHEIIIGYYLEHSDEY